MVTFTCPIGRRVLYAFKRVEKKRIRLLRLENSGAISRVTVGLKGHDYMDTERSAAW